ncbi:hypothetical protein [Aquimarina longa]|uniref:hypothetical protein n=1 Tax=Aquimarina longa TaxID=1080221 RepID=UPI00130D961F|nr:hypothetical protein [Aquimarina longa]
MNFFKTLFVISFIFLSISTLNSCTAPSVEEEQGINNEDTFSTGKDEIELR